MSRMDRIPHEVLVQVMDASRNVEVGLKTVADRSEEGDEEMLDSMHRFAVAFYDRTNMGYPEQPYTPALRMAILGFFKDATRALNLPEGMER